MKICSVAGCNKGYYAKGRCKEHYFLNYNGLYYSCNKKRILLSAKKYYRGNKKEILNKNSTTNREVRRAYMASYRARNKEKIAIQMAAYHRVYHKRRLERDPLFKFKTQVRTLINSSFTRKGFHKNTRTEKILGCTLDGFKLHLESKFKSGWTFENHGTTWDIDHIIPLKTAQTIEDVVRLCHYTNLQPLECWLNRFEKRDKLDWV